MSTHSLTGIAPTFMSNTQSILTVRLRIDFRADREAYQVSLIFTYPRIDPFQFQLMFEKSYFHRLPIQKIAEKIMRMSRRSVIDILNRLNIYSGEDILMKEIEHQLMPQLERIVNPPMPNSVLSQYSREMAEDFDERMTRYFMNAALGLGYGNSDIPQKKLTLFPDMGREPLVKEILSEVKMLSKEDSSKKIAELIDKIK